MRVVSFLPRLVALTVIWLLLTAAITFAAGERLQTTAAPQVTTTPGTTTTAAPAVLVVPDVRHQAYVFAKGILEDAGFAWKVTGAVPGFASNLVAAQLPAPGTRVVDTGAPTIALQLAKGSYGQQGAPENTSPFAGTRLVLADVAAAPKALAKPRPKALAKPRPKPAAKPKHAAVPKRTAAAAVPRQSKAKAPAVPHPRLAAFTGPGTRPEPQDELPLPVRAARLEQWLASRPKPTDANVKHWLYQHAWIVAGARAGWWHGSDALKTLIDVDRRVWQLWGIGARSESIARTALAEVEARAS
jgi:hypothetical protein